MINEAIGVQIETSQVFYAHMEQDISWQEIFKERDGEQSPLESNKQDVSDIPIKSN